MRITPRGLAASAVATLILAAAVPAAANVPLQGEGVWKNPKGSVHVELKPCGTEICGYVVYASPKAEKDAREAGTPKLVGMQLLRGFKVGADRIGRGKVFVPDLKGTFSGTAEQVDANTLRVKGCLFANVLCKTQLWTRVPG